MKLRQPAPNSEFFMEWGEIMTIFCHELAHLDSDVCHDDAFYKRLIKIIKH